MMRSMYSAVSGLRVHQTKMDVIGNNIANVNTVGYKKGQMTFQEVFSQVIRGAGAPQGGKGGTNPQQIGLGVGIGSINTIHTKGPTQTTDNPTDLMIDGEGFFVVTDDTNYENKYYTRAGNFTLDKAGNLVTPDGFKVLGYKVDENENITDEIGPIVINRSGKLEGFSIDPSGVVSGIFTNGERKDLGQVMLAKFDNPMGLQKLGNNFFVDTRNSGEAQLGKPGTSGFGATKSGSLEMSNVDLSMEFTEMITTQRGFQANSRIITTSDEMLQELVNMKR